MDGRSRSREELLRVGQNGSGARTSGRRKTRSNACHRCKTKKLRCHYTGQTQHKCRACEKADSDCVFDVTPDGVPRGSSYIISLEEQISSLRNELREARLGNQSRDRLPLEGGPSDASDIQTAIPNSGSIISDNQRSAMDRLHAESHSAATFGFTEMVDSLLLAQKTKSQTESDITPFNMLQAAPSISRVETPSPLPSLPSERAAEQLIEAAYLYTQARYCIVDWVRVREWHKRRELICYATSEDDVDSQTGAFFIWIVYAIGARFCGNHEYSSSTYFARARAYLSAVVSLQNLTTVQALLTLVQYSFRATGGPSVWHLIGICLRLCIELSYHRSATVGRDTDDPYEIELRKRFFWCVYAFDRAISYISKRPFGISDADIDVQFPLDIDLTCMNSELLRTLQGLQASGTLTPQNQGTTTMSSVLHQLRLDRIRSRIMTMFMAPNATPPSSEQAWFLLAELDDWRQQAPQKLPAPFPQHSPERVHATWLQVALLLLRLVLSQPVTDQELLLRCATLSAEACENTKVLSLSPQTHTSPIQVYHCFNCGLGLLQCLALQPTILPTRKTMRAIMACSSALAIYTRTLSTAAVFLNLFEMLSDRFLGEDESVEEPQQQNLELQTILKDIITSTPAEMPGILKSLSEGNPDKQQREIQPGAYASQIVGQHTAALDSASMPNMFPTSIASGFTEPFEMFYDMTLLYDYNTQNWGPGRIG